MVVPPHQQVGFLQRRVRTATRPHGAPVVYTPTLKITIMVSTQRNFLVFVVLLASTENFHASGARLRRSGPAFPVSAPELPSAEDVGDEEDALAVAQRGNALFEAAAQQYVSDSVPPAGRNKAQLEDSPAPPVAVTDLVPSASGKQQELAGKKANHTTAVTKAEKGNTSDSSSTHKIPTFLQLDGEELPLDPTVCDPPCIEGRGTCNDNRCFCKSPYEGTTCQHKVQMEKRLGPTLSTGILLSALVVGCGAGFFVHQMLTKLLNVTEVGMKLVRKETWKPSEGSEPKKKGKR